MNSYLDQMKDRRREREREREYVWFNTESKATLRRRIIWMNFS